MKLATYTMGGVSFVFKVLTKNNSYLQLLYKQFKIIYRNKVLQQRKCEMKVLKAYVSWTDLQKTDIKNKTIILLEEMGTRGSGEQRISKSFESLNQKNIIQAAR